MNSLEAIHVWTVRIQSNRFGHKAIQFLKDNPAALWIYRVFIVRQIKMDCKQPTENMMQAKAYFKKQKELIEENMALLEDDLSRVVYQKMIRFRCCYDLKEFPPYNRRNQYFDEDLILLREDEVFIDCGAYHGDTVKKFIRCYQRGFQKSLYNIVAFEPDEEIYSRLKEKYRKNSRVRTICAGVSDKEKYLFFEKNKGGGTTGKFLEAEHKSGEHDMCVQVKVIDKVPECKDATFIKMDIEGFEMKALHGAMQTIQRNKPKLAICIYHSDRDMLEIIRYLHQLVPAYRFYIRQHDYNYAETVLYAVL